jgi:hypothetical protein
MPLSDDQTDPFNRFMAAFPARDEPHDVAAAREAWERAIGRADSEAIILGSEAYARAREGQPARYTMGAARWLRESRWRDAAPVSGDPGDAGRNRHADIEQLTWIEYGSLEWEAWSVFYRATRGKTPPQDMRGGWRFPSRWPPAPRAAVDSNG